jgi:hypothetical protein
MITPKKYCILSFMMISLIITYGKSSDINTLNDFLIHQIETRGLISNESIINYQLNQSFVKISLLDSCSINILGKWRVGVPSPSWNKPIRQPKYVIWEFKKGTLYIDGKVRRYTISEDCKTIKISGPTSYLYDLRINNESSIVIKRRNSGPIEHSYYLKKI